MQPVIVCAARVPGMVYLNGRFAGEASRLRPLYAPVSPVGAAYLEYRPLTGEGGIARRCVFSGGMPMADSLARAEGLYCVAWPGGVLEAEFDPPRPASRSFLLEDMPCAIDYGEAGAVLTLNGLEVPLPEDAMPPRLARAEGAALLLGDRMGGGQYAAALSPGLDAFTGMMTADRIDLAGGGMLSAIVSLGDSVGHGLLEQWIADGNGLTRASSESVWSHGAPRWPETAEGAAVAAAEAALAGLPAEAEGYLAPTLAAERPLERLAEICQGVLPMRYGLPGERPCVGLVSVENDHLAVVRPLYYRAERSGGAQGPWRLTWISTDIDMD